MELASGLKKAIGHRLLLVVLFIFCSLPHQVQAQETRLEALVEAIAGANIYLNIGADEGIQDSDTLLVLRGQTQLGYLQVVAVTQARTVATFIATPFTVTRGDALTVVINTTAAIAEAPSQEVLPDTTAYAERRSVFERGTTRVQLPPVEEGIRVTGRLTLGMDLSRTSTEGIASDFSRTRNYRIPRANLRAAIEELPGNLRINVNARFAHRDSESLFSIDPLNSLRIYKLNIERAIPGRPLQVRLGRFYNPAETFSGFWDGLGVAYAPDTGFGGGMLAGFQPERANEQFTDELPKYTVFGTFTHINNASKLRYNANVSFHQIRPTNQFLNHTFFGINHTFKRKLFRVRHMMQIDQDPVSDAWEITRLQVYGTVPVGERLAVRGRYMLRRPYQIFRIEDVISYKRERISGGVTLRALSGTFSADVSTQTSDVSARSITLSTFANLPGVSPLNLQLSTAVFYWRNASNADVLYIAPAVARHFGKAFTQLQYQFQQSYFDIMTAQTHTLEWALNYPITRRVRTSIRLQSRWGDAMTLSRIYTNLWIKI